MISKYTLAAALKSVGNAEIFVGDPFIANGMTSLGALEGRVRFSAPRTMNKLTAPELTGEVAHQATHVLGEVSITVPLITDGDMNVLFGKVDTAGVGGGGSSAPEDVFTTGVLLLPRKEIGGGLSWNTGVAQQWERLAGGSVPAATGAAAAPKGAVWFWRASPSMAEIPYVYESGGKQVIDVTYTAMWYDGAIAIPERHKVFTVGDPRRTGVAIPVIL